MDAKREITRRISTGAVEIHFRDSQEIFFLEPPFISLAKVILREI